MSFKFRCIKCGKSWGERTAENEQTSHGICIGCFAGWFNEKRKEQNLKECFGQFNEYSFECNKCLVKRFCKEYNGIK